MTYTKRVNKGITSMTTFTNGHLLPIALNSKCVTGNQLLDLIDDCLSFDHVILGTDSQDDINFVFSGAKSSATNVNPN